MDETKQPELVFGLVGPIGVDMAMVQTKLIGSLKAVGYRTRTIRVTELMSQIGTQVVLDETLNPLKHYESRIDYANAVRARCGNDAALAALAIHRIRNLREEIESSKADSTSPQNNRCPIDRWPSMLSSSASSSAGKKLTCCERSTVGNSFRFRPT